MQPENKNQGMQKESPDQQLEKELIEMGFQINQIKQAMKLTHDKQKIVENLITSQQLSQDNVNLSQGKLLQKESINKQNKQKSQKMQIQKQSVGDGDYESYEQDYKMVFLLRMDLKLGIGKMAAQVASAALAAYKQIYSKIQFDQFAQIAYYQWLESGQKKIALKVQTLNQLQTLVQKIKNQKINVYVKTVTPTDQIKDIPEGTITVAAVGPAPEEILDKLTGHLKLY